ncbi:EH domain-containing protein 4 [Grus japonensis]|uniref:EH domain-containing protein 4 n=1 Tax=Grus japonensis TaxID=30415 RepID=A0ABC9WYQ2_GRUJA
MPASSKMDPLLAKAKPISNGGSASGIAYLRRGKTAAEQQPEERSEKIPWRMMVEQRFHLQPVEDPTPEQVETPEGGCDPMGSLHYSRLLAGPVNLWREEPTPEQVCWQDL